MEESLNFENILGQEDIDNLFVDSEETQESSPEENNSNEDNSDETEKTTEIDPEDLFEDQSESVGSEEETIEDQEGTNSVKDKGTSPKNNFYSSIALALKEDGTLPDLDDEFISSIKEPEDFANAIEKQVLARFDERLKRIDEALNVGIEPSEIKVYENTLNYLDSITDGAITEEGTNGEELRKKLIFLDFINRGYSKERANREVLKSLNSGSDIDDAKDALQGNKDFFKGKYNDLIEEAKADELKEIKERNELAEKLKNSIINEKKVFGDIELDKNTRQRIYDNISKPVYKDPETGLLLTAIQKYEMENKTDFLKNVSLVYTLTDGFKSLDKLVKGKVNKEVKKGLRNLELKINNTARSSDGSLKFASGSDPESKLVNWDLDI